MQQEFDFYINLKKPTLGLYVRTGAGLPDLVDTSDWQFDGHVWQSEPGARHPEGARGQRPCVSGTGWVMVDGMAGRPFVTDGTMPRCRSAPTPCCQNQPAGIHKAAR